MIVKNTTPEAINASLLSSWLSYKHLSPDEGLAEGRHSDTRLSPVGFPRYEQPAAARSFILFLYKKKIVKCELYEFLNENFDLSEEDLLIFFQENAFQVDPSFNEKTAILGLGGFSRFIPKKIANFSDFVNHPFFLFIIEVPEMKKRKASQYLSPFLFMTKQYLAILGFLTYHLQQFELQAKTDRVNGPLSSFCYMNIHAEGKEYDCCAYFSLLVGSLYFAHFFYTTSAVGPDLIELSMYYKPFGLPDVEKPPLLASVTSISEKMKEGSEGFLWLTQGKLPDEIVGAMQQAYSDYSELNYPTPLLFTEHVLCRGNKASLWALFKEAFKTLNDNRPLPRSYNEGSRVSIETLESVKGQEKNTPDILQAIRTLKCVGMLCQTMAVLLVKPKQERPEFLKAGVLQPSGERGTLKYAERLPHSPRSSFVIVKGSKPMGSRTQSNASDSSGYGSPSSLSCSPPEESGMSN